MKGTKLVDTAYHEAGHAVAAWWFGQLKKRDHVTIIPDPQTGSLGDLRNPSQRLSDAIQWPQAAHGRL